ncbi:glycosyltransferase [Shewanella baltica]|uniref:glycosyltransferase n=1 Tax=Shewanella baltica TaxID=62322 RepID=UPI0024B9D530|nr:glycosyltransferase [Shewanella baltica]
MTLNVYYIGPFEFPCGGAAARRIQGNLNSLKSVGAKVKVIDGQSVTSSSFYEGTEIISLGERPFENDSKVRKVYKYFTIGRNTIDYIEQQTNKPDVIILYSGYSPYLFKLIPYCKLNQIKLIFDCVEWYAPAKGYGYFKPYYWNIELAMRFLIPKCDGIICISNYLNRYYLNKTKTLKIPPTLDTLNMPEKTFSSPVRFLKEPFRLVYTGNPGHKDKLQEIINVVKTFPEFELHIAGVEGVNCINIFYYGNLSYSEAIKLVSNSHFSVLFRPENIVSKAGFSTKVVESLSCGTPVITNNTGDLSDIIIDGVNGFIFDGVEQEDLANKLNFILDGNEFDYQSMSNEAKETASNKFDFRVFSDDLLRFLRE